MQIWELSLLIYAFGIEELSPKLQEGDPKNFGDH